MEKVKQILNNIKQPSKTRIDCDGWREFYLKDILEIDGTGKEIISNLELGDINLVSSGESNNGIVKKVKIAKKIFSKNKITLAKNGSVGVIFYQNQPFCATSDILILSNDKLNKNIALFLKVIAEQQTKKFSWTDKINIPKYNNLKIFLPAKNNQPDWEYMDEFISNIKMNMNL